MHKGEAAERPIHGTATLSEVKELAEKACRVCHCPNPSSIVNTSPPARQFLASAAKCGVFHFTLLTRAVRSLPSSIRRRVSVTFSLAFAALLRNS